MSRSGWMGLSFDSDRASASPLISSRISGRDTNEQGDGSILPVNTALGFPTLGGTTTDLSLVVTQKFGDAVSVSVGKFNVLDLAAATPLMGGAARRPSGTPASPRQSAA